MNISDLLLQVPIFATLEAEEHVILKEYIEQQRFKADEYLFKEKDPGDGLHVIAMGAVKIVKTLDGVNNKTLAGLTDLDFFGEMALLGDQIRTATVKIKEQTALLKLSRSDILQLAETNPELKARLEDAKSTREIVI